MSRSIPGMVRAKPPPLSGWRCERQAGVAAVNKAIASKKYNIVILDEVNVLLYFKIIALDPILKIITGKPENIELILTGRNAPEEILERADLVTEMKEIKHYYTENVPARAAGLARLR